VLVGAALLAQASFRIALRTPATDVVERERELEGEIRD
jgi:hypothetical protein